MEASYNGRGRSWGCYGYSTSHSSDGGVKNGATSESGKTRGKPTTVASDLRGSQANETREDRIEDMDEEEELVIGPRKGDNHPVFQEPQNSRLPQTRTTKTEGVQKLVVPRVPKKAESTGAMTMCKSFEMHCLHWWCGIPDLSRKQAQYECISIRINCPSTQSSRWREQGLNGRHGVVMPKRRTMMAQQICAMALMVIMIVMIIGWWLAYNTTDGWWSTRMTGKEKVWGDRKPILQARNKRVSK